MSFYKKTQFLEIIETPGVAVCGGLWQAVAVSGTVWYFVAFFEILWQSVEFCGSL